MHKIGKYNKNLIAIMLVFSLIIVIYSATSTINVVAQDPIECKETFFSTEDVCYNPERIAFNNYQTSIDVKLKKLDLISLASFGFNTNSEHTIVRSPSLTSNINPGKPP